MELVLHYHPYEVLRRARNILVLLVDDQSLRFKEVRQRLALQLRMEVLELEIEKKDPDLFQKVEELITEWEKFPYKIAWTEVFQLSEFNERYLDLNLFLDIHRLRLCLREPLESYRARAWSRLLAIEKILRNQYLARNAPLNHVLYARWNHANLRDEANYFLALLKA